MTTIASSFSAACRAVLPDRLLQILRGRHNSVRQRFIRTPIEKLQLWWHLARGGTYIAWYSKRLDSFAEGTSLTSLDPEDARQVKFAKYLDSGIKDLDVMKKMGLKPHHDVHEIGSGHGRSAHYFIDYLDAGKYSGNEISKERVRFAREHISMRGLDDKDYRMLVTQDNSFDWMDGRVVDFVWANSVFGHMPPEDVESIIANVHKIMHEKSVFYFTVRGRDPKVQPTRLSAKDWVRDNDFWANLAKRFNLRIEPAEYILPEDFVPQDARLMKLTVA